MKPNKLTPVFKDYLWGGKRLAEKYGKKTDLDIIAESWELSCHSDGLCTVDGRTTLKDWLGTQKNDVLGRNCADGDEFPLLVKLIDAAKDLSVQVHPNDDFARKYENSQGKTEMWVVLDCENGAYLYYGFNWDVSAAQVRQAITDNTLTALLNQVIVSPGDVFFIKPGTVHAIGAGTLIAEIQQNSNITYRMYDYGRVDTNGKPRRLDIEKALAVAEMRRTDITVPKLHSRSPAMSSSSTRLMICDYFTVYRVESCNQAMSRAGIESFETLLVLSGACELIQNGNHIPLCKGESVFICANSGEYTLLGQCTYLRIFAGRVEASYADVVFAL